MYDSTERHQRYLRERDLKGRRPAAAKPVVTRKPGALHPSVSRVKKPLAKPVKKLPLKKAPPKKTAAERQKEIRAQVDALKGRLETLRKVLQELTKQAQAKNGNQLNIGEPAKKLTPAQKRKAAESRKKSDQKNDKDPTPSEELKALQTKIKAVQTKIKEMREKLAEAAKKPVRKAVPVGDRKQH